MKQNSHLTPHIKINAQRDVEFTVKGQSDELLEEYTEEFLYDLRMEKWFSQIGHKTSIINKLDFIKIKN